MKKEIFTGLININNIKSLIIIMFLTFVFTNSYIKMFYSGIIYILIGIIIGTIFWYTHKQN